MTTMTRTEPPIESIPAHLSPSNWTSPQELSLLHAIIDHKPVGLHKHFRMISIQNHILSSGAIPNPTAAPHASTSKGIWAKLDSLYDLKALDEREDAVFEDAVNESTGEREDESQQYWREFELPEDEYGNEMWERRLGESEDWSEEDGDVKRERERESTVADSEGLRSSPVDASVGSARGTRSSGRRNAGKRLSEMKQDESTGRSVKKSAKRRASPEEDVEMGTGTGAGGGDDDDDGEEDEDDSEEGSGDEETEDDKKTSTRGTRGRGGRRGRGRRGRRAK